MKRLSMLMVSLLILASSTTALAAPATSGTPQMGGILKVYIVGDPNNFWPPVMSGQTDGQISCVALETLFRFDQKGNLVPLLAIGNKVDPTAKTITISLREGVKFHDGSDFNAAVAKWNLDQYRAKGKGELEKVTSIEVVDNNTIRLNLSAFDSTIISNLTNGADVSRMISQKAFEANGGGDWAARNPVGTGPFQLASWTKSVGITWKRFDEYWGGRPYLDGIQMKVYANATAAKLDFLAGNLHIFRVQNPRDAKELQAVGKYNVIVPQDGQGWSLVGYAKDPTSPFAKLEVRQAMSYAIDVNAMSDAFGLGYWKVWNQWAMPGAWGYNKNIKGYPYNPKKAKELLAAAGYPQGFKTTFNFLNLSQTAMDQATSIQNYLKAVGIEVTLNPLLRPAYTQMAGFGKGWPGIILQQGYHMPDPLVRVARVIAGQEFLGEALPEEVINAYNAAIIATDFTTKQKLTWHFLALTVDKYCMATYLYLLQNPVVKTKNVHDDLYGEVPYSYISPKAWLSK